MRNQCIHKKNAVTISVHVVMGKTCSVNGPSKNDIFATLAFTCAM